MSRRNSWLTPLLTTGACIGFALAAIVVGQRKLMYFPFKTGVQRPFDLPIKDIYFNTTDGVKLHGWLLHKNLQQRTLLFFHGNAGDVNARGPLMSMLNRFFDCNVFLIDYRGFGLSEPGQGPTEEALIEDGLSSLKYLKEEGYEDIVLYGRSLGGAVALGVAEKLDKNDISGIILENTISSMPDMASVAYPFLKYVTYIPGAVFDTWDSESRIQKLSHFEIMFLSGQKDTLVPPEQMTRLYEAYGGNGQFVKLENSSHEDTWWRDRPLMRQSFAEFLEKCGNKN